MHVYINEVKFKIYIFPHCFSLFSGFFQRFQHFYESKMTKMILQDMELTCSGSCSFFSFTTLSLIYLGAMEDF